MTRCHNDSFLRSFPNFVTLQKKKKIKISPFVNGINSSPPQPVHFLHAQERREQLNRRVRGWMKPQIPDRARTWRKLRSIFELLSFLISFLTSTTHSSTFFTLHTTELWEFSLPNLSFMPWNDFYGSFFSSNGATKHQSSAEGEMSPSERVL